MFKRKMVITRNDTISLYCMLYLVIVFFACSSPKQIDYIGMKPPGKEAQLFADGTISSNLNEHSTPAFSPDGKVVVWGVMTANYRGYLLEMRYQNGAWTKPYSPSFADTTADDFYPAFSIDGEKLYFSSRRKVPNGYPQNTGIRIWEVKRTPTGWTNPTPFDTIASKGENYAHSMTANGDLYFSSSTGNRTNWNIQKSEVDGRRYKDPVILPFNINSINYEDGPFIAPDESYLIFESQRPEGIEGSVDLYISFKNKAGEWNPPVNMGPKINSPGTERFARVSPDGKYFFWGSTKNQTPEKRGFDIYWINAEFIKDLQKDIIEKPGIESSFGDGILTALEKNDLTTAGDLLMKWVQNYPDDLDATIIYSSILRKQKMYNESSQLWNNRSAIWQMTPGVIMEKSLAKYGMALDNEAEQLLKPLLVPGDELRERYIYLSKALLDMMLVEKSDAYFEKAMAIFPSSFPYYYRAQSLAQAGEKDRAFYALNKAIELGGYNQRKSYETDSMLNPLKTDARWNTLLKKLQ